MLKMETKKCSKCKQTKPSNEFYKDERYRDKLYPSCRDCNRERHRQYHKKHSENINQRHRKWYRENTEHVYQYAKEYNEKNIPYRLSRNIRAAIWHSLKGNKNGHCWEKLVGYTRKDLIFHLEKQFRSGMSWLNYGEWHIDHIRPKSFFRFETYNDPEFKKCWSLENLQPLWAFENLSKNNKLLGGE